MAKLKVNKRQPLDTSPRKAISTLEQLLANKQSPIDVKEIAYAFMSKLGGTEGFVERILGEYESCDAGSLARSRILDIMVKLFQIATPKERFGDYADVSDEDLTALLHEKLGTKPRPPAKPDWIEHVCI